MAQGSAPEGRMGLVKVWAVEGSAQATSTSARKIRCLFMVFHYLYFTATLPSLWSYSIRSTTGYDVTVGGRRPPPHWAQVRTCASLGANTCASNFNFSEYTLLRSHAHAVPHALLRSRSHAHSV